MREHPEGRNELVVPPMIGERTKIFGIGLSRTGTMSLTSALQMLGIETQHYPNDVQTQDELKRGCYDLSVLNTVRALTDITVAPFYAQLDRLFPDSRFILTTRPTDDWLASVENHFRTYVEHRREPFDDFVFASVYGTLHFSAERFRYVKELHEENVKRYFASQPEKLLVLDLSRDPGWDAVCAFLGLSVPDEPFPRLNQARLTPATRARPSWRRRLLRQGRTT
jgi:hypothetical protein